MTLEEARSIAAIASTADNGCFVCAVRLMVQLQAAFPAFVWTYERNPDPEPPESDDDWAVEPYLAKVITVAPL